MIEWVNDCMDAWGEHGCMGRHECMREHECMGLTSRFNGVGWKELRLIKGLLLL